MSQKPYVNLIPTPMQRRLVLRREMKRWLVVVALLGIIATAHAGTLFFRQQSLVAEMKAVEQQVGPVLVLAQKCRDQQARIQKAETEIAEFESLQWAPSTLHLLGVVATSAVDQKDAITIDSFNFQCSRQVAEQERTTRRVNNAPTEYNGMVTTRLSMNGTAPNDRAISRFLSRLRTSAMFEQLDLRSARNVEHYGGFHREFVIEGQLIMKGTK